jgi:hypothetical protein
VGAGLWARNGYSMLSQNQYFLSDRGARAGRDLDVFLLQVRRRPFYIIFYLSLVFPSQSPHPPILLGTSTQVRRRRRRISPSLSLSWTLSRAISATFDWRTRESQTTTLYCADCNSRLSIAPAAVAARTNAVLNAIGNRLNPSRTPTPAQVPLRNVYAHALL